MPPIKTHTLPAPTILKYTFGTLLILLFVAYLVFQARLFIAGPTVSITNNPAVLQNEKSVELAGVAQNITEISINDRLISTDEAGNFRESIILENGYTIVSLKARDRYGRETEVTREFIYSPRSPYNN